MSNMAHMNAIVQELESTVAAYMRDRRPLDDTRAILATQIEAFVGELARELRQDCGSMPAREPGDERARRQRSVFAGLIIGAERRARADGRSLDMNEIERLLRLMCWMRDTAEDLANKRSPPIASEAA